MLEFEGLEFGWENLRFLYYWGGDGVIRTKINLLSFAAKLHDHADEGPKECLMPFTGSVAIEKKTPKDAGLTETTSITFRFSDICLVARLTQAKILRNCAFKLQSIMAKDYPQTSSPSTSAFRPSQFDSQLKGRSVKIQLEDDRETWHTDIVCTAAVTDCAAHCRIEQRAQRSPPQTNADFSGALQVDTSL